MECSDPEGGDQTQGDPCGDAQQVVGIVMSQPQLESLYALTRQVGTTPGCGGGILVDLQGSNNYFEVDPVLAPTCGSGLAFNSAFTVSWWGLLWFSAGGSLDPYTVSLIVESPPQVSVSTQ
jgi:hypothetical protein